MRNIGQFLIALSGARPEILARCPTERIKFQSLGWAILITCAMATVSMWFALTSVMGFNPVLVFPVAIIWGLVIMGIDRWLVTSLPIDGSRKWTIAVPRLVLAALLGSLISTPIVLRIFQSEINNQITVIKEDRAAAFISAQQHSSVAQQVTKWTGTVNNLQKVIDSRGSVAINPSSDPDVQSLTRQLNAELALQQKYYKQWQCQLYGGPGCPQGNGVLAQASEASYNQAKQQVSVLTSDIHARESQLSASDAASQQSRYQQAVNELPAAQQQLTAATDREDALQRSFDTTNNATNGLLIRLQALNQLSGNNFTLNSARLLLFLLFLVIECLPVTVKLLQQPGIYEEILKTAARRELNDARRAIREQPSFQPQAPESEFPADLGSDRHDSVDAEIDRIWRVGATKVMPIPDWQSTAETDVLDRPEEVSGEASPFEDALRRVTDTREMSHFTDTRDVNGSRGRQGDGIERHYGDDDL